MFGNKKRKSYFNLQSPIDVLGNKVSEIGERITTNPLDKIMSGNIQGVPLNNDLTALNKFRAKTGKFNNSMFGQVLGIDDATRLKVLNDEAQKLSTQKQLNALMFDLSEQNKNLGRTPIKPFEYTRPINLDGGSYTDMLPNDNVAGSPLVVASESNNETDQEFINRVSQVRQPNNAEQNTTEQQVNEDAEKGNSLLKDIEDKRKKLFKFFF